MKYELSNAIFFAKNGISEEVKMERSFPFCFSGMFLYNRFYRIQMLWKISRWVCLQWIRIEKQIVLEIWIILWMNCFTHHSYGRGMGLGIAPETLLYQRPINFQMFLLFHDCFWIMNDMALSIFWQFFLCQEWFEKSESSPWLK